MPSSLAPAEGGPASPVSKTVEPGNGRTAASPVRHMHPDVAEILLAAGSASRRRRRRRPTTAPAAAEARGRARYDGAFKEEAPAEAGFAPPQLVWAKVRGHPWWPGQVFDPADASATALREKRRRDAVLVACFGDGTFVWAHAEDLLPFRDGFPLLADTGGRSTSKPAFAPALDDALGEVSRRVDAGLSCGCGAAASTRRQVFVNSGIRRGARGAAVDEAFARDAFRGEAFVGYVRALAVAPQDGADRLDLAVAAAQLKAFARWRSAANPEHDSTAGVDDAANGAMVVAARAGRGRATTPRRQGARRCLLRGDAPAAGVGDVALSMCARAAAADKAFMRGVFSSDARLEEYASAMAVTPPPPAGACYRRDDLGKKARPTGGDDADADADAGMCTRALTSCISSGEDSACEKDGGDDDGAWETESEESEPAWEWEMGWKDYVIVIQFVAIALLVCQLQLIQ